MMDRILLATIAKSVAVVCIAASAQASPIERIDQFDQAVNVLQKGELTWEGSYSLRGNPPLAQEGSPVTPGPAPGFPNRRFSTQLIEVSGYTTELGEPLIGGMKNTAWRSFKVETAGRVVLQTFGSDYDTLLATYRGNTFSDLTRIGFNDDKTVFGLPKGGSLLQFDVKSGDRFFVQVGSKSGKEGDLYLSRSFLPPEGGLVAQLQLLDGLKFVGRDYSCSILAGTAGSCPAPTFLVYNASDKRLTINASSSLGIGVVAPPSFELEPGQAAVKSYSFNADFDKTRVRDVAGAFRFSGVFSRRETFRSETPGLITVRNGTILPDVLKVSVAPSVRAAQVGDLTIFPFKITNTGATRVKGCTFRGESQDFTNVFWRPYNPVTLKTFSAVNTLAAIYPGATDYYAVGVASLRSRTAISSLGLHIEMHCTNTANAKFDLSNRIDVTSASRIIAANTWVDFGVATKINVPANGAIVRAHVQNFGPTTKLIAHPIYVAPLNETDPKKRFTVAICPSTATVAACMMSTAKSLPFTGVTNETVSFKIVVRPPAIDPGFDGGARRVFLQIDQAHPDLGLIPVGSAGIAVRAIAGSALASDEKNEPLR